MKDYLKWIIVGGVFVIPFLAFLVAESMFFPYITGKNFAFRIIVEIMFGAWVVLAYLDARYRPKLSFITMAVLFLLVATGISDIFGENLFKSLWSNYERMDGYITTVHLGMYFLVVGSVMQTRAYWDALFNTTIAASVILGFMGLNQLFSDTYSGARLATTLGNSIYLAVYMLFHIFITAYMLFREKMKEWGIRQYLYIGALVVQFVNLYFTATRGTILGLVGGTLLTAILIALFEKNRTLKRVARFSLLGLVGLIVAFLAFRDTALIQSSPVLARFTHISLSNESGHIEDRFLIWGMAYEGFKERPVLGWGQENFPYVFNEYYDPRLFDAEPWFDRAHNVFLDWLITGGVVGLVAYLSIFAAALYLIWKKKEDDFSLLSKALFTGFLAGYFFHNIFVFDNLVSYILFFTFLSFIHAANVDVSHGSVFEKMRGWWSRMISRHETNEDTPYLAAGVGAITLLVVYSVNYGAYAQNMTIIKALKLGNEKAPESLALYKEALSYDTFGNAETRERLALQAQQIARAQGIAQNVKDEYMAVALDEITKQMNETGRDSKYPLFASGLYTAKGDYMGAVGVLEKAREYAPKKDIVLLSLGDAYVNMGQTEKGLEMYKATYENEPRNTKAAVRWAYAELLSGDEQQASDILTPIYGTHLIPDQVIVGFYANKGRFDVIRDIYVKAIADDPTKPEYRFQLAGAYLQLGEKDEAIAVLQLAKQDFPDDKAVQNDTTQYIQQLQAEETTKN